MGIAARAAMAWVGAPCHGIAPGGKFAAILPFFPPPPPRQAGTERADGRRCYCSLRYVLNVATGISLSEAGSLQPLAVMP